MKCLALCLQFGRDCCRVRINFSVCSSVASRYPSKMAELQMCECLVPPNERTFFLPMCRTPLINILRSPCTCECELCNLGKIVYPNDAENNTLEDETPAAETNVFCCQGLLDSLMSRVRAYFRRLFRRNEAEEPTLFELQQ